MVDILDQNGQPVQQEPKFPQTNVNVGPHGMTVQIVLAPGLAINTALDEEVMNQVMKMWVQTRKNIADQLRTIEHVKSTKLN